MSQCRLKSTDARSAALAATVLALLLYQANDLNLVAQWRAGIPLHFVEGVLLGIGLGLMVSSLAGRRRGG